MHRFLMRYSKLQVASKIHLTQIEKKYDFYAWALPQVKASFVDTHRTNVSRTDFCDKYSTNFGISFNNRKITILRRYSDDW